MRAAFNAAGAATGTEKKRPNFDRFKITQVPSYRCHSNLSQVVFSYYTILLSRPPPPIPNPLFPTLVRHRRLTTDFLVETVR